MTTYKKGIAPLIVVLIIVALGAGIYFAVQTRDGDVPQGQGEEMTDKNGDAMEDAMFEAIIAKAQSIDLKDVARSGAAGRAWLAVHNGKTYHRVSAQNLPALPGADFYEGWLVKNPATGDFFSTGKLNYNPQTKEGKLDFVVDGDKSDYRFVVITSEPNDGNPAPDKHIIEERFTATANLSVVLEVMDKENGDTMMPAQGGSTSGGEKPKIHVIEMTAVGFVPANLTIKKGDTVEFVNKDTRDWWPASGIHPTHELCPGFDSLRGLKPGERYSFTFNEARGLCPMHDHLKPSVKGQISIIIQ